MCAYLQLKILKLKYLAWVPPKFKYNNVLNKYPYDQNKQNPNSWKLS